MWTPLYLASPGGAVLPRILLLHFASYLCMGWLNFVLLLSLGRDGLLLATAWLAPLAGIHEFLRDWGAALVIAGSFVTLGGGSARGPAGTARSPRGARMVVGGVLDPAARALGPGHAWVYVSAGTGSWGPPVRFGSEPELTLIRRVRPLSAP